METVIKCKVRFFDINKHSGYVTDLNTGISYPINGCNIQGHKTLFNDTCCTSYKEGQIVDCLLDDSIVEYCGVIGLTDGDVDLKEWNRINDGSLAFVCNEQGKAINGLFAVQS